MTMDSGWTGEERRKEFCAMHEVRGEQLGGLAEKVEELAERTVPDLARAIAETATGINSAVKTASIILGGLWAIGAVLLAFALTQASSIAGKLNNQEKIGAADAVKLEVIEKTCGGLNDRVSTLERQLGGHLSMPHWWDLRERKR